jgi:hypothetical protein
VHDDGGLLRIADFGRPFAVEQALVDDINSEMGGEFKSNRFIPFVVMHEFEALLFSDCAAFARGVGRPGIEAPLQAIRDNFSTPEEIDDSPETAPSKRIGILIPGYQKPVLGVQAASEIGLEDSSGMGLAGQAGSRWEKEGYQAVEILYTKAGVPAAVLLAKNAEISRVFPILQRIFLNQSAWYPCLKETTNT